LQYRLTRFGIQSTALIVGLIYFVLAVVCIPFFYLATRNAPNGGLPGIVLVIGPVVYGIIGYVFTAIGCWLYNLIASWTGGMVLTLESGESVSV
jgi:hypothetical protein